MSTPILNCVLTVFMYLDYCNYRRKLFIDMFVKIVSFSFLDDDFCAESEEQQGETGNARFRSSVKVTAPNTKRPFNFVFGYSVTRI